MAASLIHRLIDRSRTALNLQPQAGAAHPGRGESGQGDRAVAPGCQQAGHFTWP